MEKICVNICPRSSSSPHNTIIVNFRVRPVCLPVLGLLAALLFFSYAGATTEETIPTPGLQPVYR
ncbi:MAG: hypothetical protein KJP19_04380, partial [Deltaproteobacteria bacterium]|nr:hypothetical protein [Deltaproteobacteria bacterium]